LFILLIAQGCYVRYINDVNKDTPPAEPGTGVLVEQDLYTTTEPPTEPSQPAYGVQLACTSITGETEVVAQYDSVPCPMDLDDER
jgi:hypothetical protein